MIKAAIMGYGTIGSGVFHVLNTNKEIITKRTGDPIEIAYVLDLREFPGDPVEDVLVHDFNEILNDDAVAIVAETMGGLHPAYDFTKQLLEAGKSVCTSNKEVVAAYGYELMHTAREHNANYMFEASCGGGIPIIRPIDSSLTGEVIKEVSGILNGTTNFILSKMETDGSDFDEALKEAQDNGYAELHPEADIEGWDPCRKIAILSSLAYGGRIDYEDIHTEGITNVSPADISYAKHLGVRIKLMGSSTNTQDGVAAIVAPFMIGSKSPLYNVQDVFNAVFVRGNMLGDSMFYGSGAGKLPTASAVVGDMIDSARHRGISITRGWKNEKINLIPYEEMKNRFFVRVSGTPEEKGGRVKEIFGADEFVTVPEAPGEFAFFTGEMKEAEFCAKAESLGAMISFIRSRI